MCQLNLEKGFRIKVCSQAIFLITQLSFAKRWKFRARTKFRMGSGV